mmetsp:Transcript_1818/g.5187  ORF Transcript_1818/g.5187 Transcript_1818/m.5187 type:complete len:658 (+) Transcript_1818:24-1997(+)
MEAQVEGGDGEGALAEVDLSDAATVTVKPQRKFAFPDGRSRIDSATSLWRAAEHGDLGRLKMLLEAGHDINAMCDDPGWRNKTPLSAAVDGNEPLAVRLLLRRGANPNLQDGDGDRYPLHWASAFGDHDECAEILVQAGASLDARDANGHTPIEFARRPVTGTGVLGVGRYLTGSRPNVEAVLETAAARDAADGRRPDWTAEHAARVLKHDFWKAAASGDLKMLDRCLKKHRQPVDQPRPASRSRMAALAIAAYNGELKAMRVLIKAGADVNRAEGEGGYTALHFCVHDADRYEATDLLLSAGADPFKVKNDGMTPHDVAKRGQRERSCDLLRKAMERRRAADALETLMANRNWLSRTTTAKLAAAIDVAAKAEVDASLLIRASSMRDEMLAQDAVDGAESGGGSSGGSGGSGSITGGGTWGLGSLGLVGAAGGFAWAQGQLSKLVGSGTVDESDGDGEGGLGGGLEILRRVRDSAVVAAASDASLPPAEDEELGAVPHVHAGSAAAPDGGAAVSLGAPATAVELVAVVAACKEGTPPEAADGTGGSSSSVGPTADGTLAGHSRSEAEAPPAAPPKGASLVAPPDESTGSEAAVASLAVVGLSGSASCVSLDGSEAAAVSEVSSGEPVVVESVESSTAEDADHEADQEHEHGESAAA